MTEVSVVYNDGKGHMTINCEFFFPAPQNKLNQMLNIVELDYEHREDAVKQFLDYLEGYQKTCEEMLPKIAEDYSLERTKMSELKDNVDHCKHTNGVPFTKDELKSAKETLKELKKEVNSLEKDFKTLQKKLQKSKINAEIVKGRLDKWSW